MFSTAFRTFNESKSANDKMSVIFRLRADNNFLMRSSIPCSNQAFQFVESVLLWLSNLKNIEELDILVPKRDCLPTSLCFKEEMTAQTKEHLVELIQSAISIRATAPEVFCCLDILSDEVCDPVVEDRFLLDSLSDCSRYPAPSSSSYQIRDGRLLHG